MIRTDIVVPHDGREVHGYFYEPEGKDSYPIVLMSHGYNGHQSDFDVTGKYFAETGIACASLTFCGGSTRDVSGYPSTEMTLFTEEEDLLALLDFVKANPKVKKDQIFLFGGSQGGLVSAMAAADRKDEIAGLILLYPALMIADNWRVNFPNVDEIPEAHEFWGLTLGKRFFVDMREFYPFDMIGNYEGPVLILQGTEDMIAKQGVAEQAANTYKNVKLELFYGEPHGFSEAGNRRMEAMMLYFIHELIGR